MPSPPVVERQTSNPASVEELSVQLSAIAEDDVADADRPLGAAGGAGVVAQSLPDRGEDGMIPPPSALTL